LASSRPGEELMSLPVRWLFGPKHSHPPDDDSPDTDSPDTDSPEAPPAQAGTADGKPAPQPDKFISSRLPALVKDAKARKPVTKNYAHVAAGPGGHKIGSNDGKQWFDLETGQQVR
jgi:hypothetical protein